jgi:DNA-binding transcriptional LysR family regulator
MAAGKELRCRQSRLAISQLKYAKAQSMSAVTQSKSLSSDDLALVLALTRHPASPKPACAWAWTRLPSSAPCSGSKSASGGACSSAIRGGYRAGELALQLAGHAERIEAELEGARSQLATGEDRVSGRVRVTTTDTVLYGLVMPVLGELTARHPHLQLELDMSYELASLSRRDADIALRATRRPPGHLVGRRLGAVRVAVYAHRKLARSAASLDALASLPWAGARRGAARSSFGGWRRKHLPKSCLGLELHGVLAVMEAVAAGIAVGVVPIFLAEAYADVLALTDPIDEAETDLWMLAHPESRHLRRIAVVAASLAENIRLDATATG